MSPASTRHVFLAGFMGCGKSTIAPLLARMLGIGFRDIDAEIERRTGKSVPEIFESSGERFFRSVEREILLETARMRPQVVALGGGTIATEESCAIVKSAGTLIYLRVDFGVLFERLRTKSDRPMLAPHPGTAPGDDALRERMRRLLAEREPFYNRADIVIDAVAENPERTAAAIAASLRAPGSRFVI